MGFAPTYKSFVIDFLDDSRNLENRNPALRDRLILRPGRESHPRITLLQRVALLLGYQALAPILFAEERFFNLSRVFKATVQYKNKFGQGANFQFLKKRAL